MVTSQQKQQNRKKRAQEHAECVFHERSPHWNYSSPRASFSAVQSHILSEYSLSANNLFFSSFV